MAKLPEGISYQPGFLPEPLELTLLEGIRLHCFPPLPSSNRPRRRVIQYGLVPGQPIPGFLLDLRLRCADWLGVAPELLAEATVIEYEPGSAIGWHHDAAVRSSLVGVSLGGPCRLCFRDTQSPHPRTTHLRLDPRSLYTLTGPACTRWLRHIPPLEARRYAVTFRAVSPRRTLEPSWLDPSRTSSFLQAPYSLPIG